jgi:predicted transglutaminase-like cysteine proteinase
MSTASPSIPFRSEIIDASGKLSISMMLQARLHWQAGTTTRSEKVSQIDSKYALSRIARAAGAEQNNDAEPEKMTLQEASNLTRVLQDQNATIQESKPVKYREIRWKGIAAVVQ